jgi:hypothetical protein
MIKLLSEPSWGVQILEETDTGEVSLQCVCGGIGLYYRRIVLDQGEIEALNEGTLDIDALASDVCKEASAIRDRIVSSLAVD